MDEIVIYTMRGCRNCSRMKELLSRTGLQYTEKKKDVDFTNESLQKIYPQLQGYPVMSIGGDFIGGIVEAVKFFVDNGLVTSKK